jgi:pimeloyl-ACP methyl ester carboxylesterase
MAAETSRAAERLEWRALDVQGRRACLAVGGRGLPVLFLHGWGLGPRAYRDTIDELMARSCRVHAPALPGFAGTADLPAADRTIEGYARWVAACIEASGIDRPVMVVGHSFGGGIAIRLAHDHPELVGHLVLVNSIGMPAAPSRTSFVPRPFTRPLWEVGLTLSRELISSRDGWRVLAAIRKDIAYNAVTNPLGLLQVGRMARDIDLSAELAVLRDREQPMLVLWSERDAVLPSSSFDALCAAIGTEGTVLRGGHSWLLANPGALSEVLDNVVRVQVTDHATTGLRTSSDEVRGLLHDTSIPGPVVDRLLKTASSLWLMSAPPAVLAADLAMCHPRLARGEVRAVARPMDDYLLHRLTVVAPDRPGLLADTASALADERLTVVAASVMTWNEPAMALHSLTVRAASLTSPDWASLGERLQAIEVEAPPPTRYLPNATATVTLVDAGEDTFVTVRAPDAIGLLEAITRWFAAHEVSIEAAEIATHGGMATDRFRVAGEFDPSELAAYLSPPSSPWVRMPRVRVGLPF